MGITLEQKIRELRRELALRERVFPRWVREEKLQQFTATQRIAIIRSILDDYEARLAAQQELFTQTRAERG